MVINVTLLYFVLLIPLSGFIAWLGDRIGHKSGKRRHTLFGLRPRHTAMVFTVGTGMCISLVAFGIVWLLSATFRRVVRDGGRLYEINRELKHDNNALAQGILALKSDVEHDKQDAASALAAKKEAEKQEDQAKAQAAAAQAAADHAQSELQSATANLAAAEANLAQTKASLSRTESSLTQTKESLTEKAQKLKTAEALVVGAHNRVVQAQEQARQSGIAALKAAGDVTAAQARVAEVLRTADLAVEQQKHALAEQKQLLDAQKQMLGDQRQQLADAKVQYDEQIHKLEELDKQVADGKKLLHDIQVNTEALREHRITYQVGEEVNRVAIKSGKNVWQIEWMLHDFMKASAEQAVLRGAHKDNGSSAAVIILPHPVMPDTGNAQKNLTTQPQIATEDDTIRAAAESIRSANTDVVVIASAVANAVRGEPVAVSLQLRKNPIIFPADTQIVDARIDGSGTNEEISDALFTFLHSKVRPTLLHAGVIPASQGGDSAEAYDDTTTLVTLKSNEWLHIMDNIRLARSNARVVVTAKGDIRAGDYPPNLQFDVKGVPSAAFRTNGPY